MLSIDIKKSFLDDSQTLIPSPYEIIQKYESYAIPPSIELGKKHGIACKISKIKSASSTKEYCICCSKPITHDQIDGTKEDLELLGQSFVTYFSFLKLCCVLLVVMWIMIGIPTLIVSLSSSEESITDSGIAGIYVDPFTILVQDNNQKISNFMLQILFVFAFFSIHKWMIIKNTKVVEEYHEDIVQASDYAILVTKLQGLNYTKEELILFIESFLKPSDQSAINEIIFGIDIEHLIRLYNQKKIIMTKIAKLSKINKDDEFLKKLNKKYNKVQINITKLQEKSLTIINDNVYNTESVIIIFNDSKDCKRILRKLDLSIMRRFLYSLLNKCCFFKKYAFKGKKVLRIVRAPEPTDIKWDALNYGGISLFIKRLLIDCTIYSFAITIWIFIFLIDRYKFQTQSLTFAFSVMIAISVYIINSVLKLLIIQTAPLRRHKSYTTEAKHIFILISTSQFFNTAFVGFFSQWSALSLNSYDTSNEITFTPLLRNMFFIFLFNTILNPLFSILDPFYIYKFLQRKLIEKNLVNCNLTQHELNKLYEEPELNFPIKYTSIIKTLFITAFYGPFIPFGILIALLEVVLIYVCDKYNIKNRKLSQPKHDLSSDLLKLILNRFGLFIVLYTFGIWMQSCIVLSYEIKMDSKKIYESENEEFNGVVVGIVESCIICVMCFFFFMISILNYFNPFELIFAKGFSEMNRNNVAAYEVVKMQFIGYREVFNSYCNESQDSEKFNDAKKILMDTTL